LKKLFSLLLVLSLALGLMTMLPAATGAEENKNLLADATWTPGSFYDAAEPNPAHATTRRYTVIPCKEGETYSFKMPTTNWRLYIYPADDKGSINGDWFEMKDGMQYLIKPINGRTPTKLRITACPNPDGQLTDEMWTKFDVECFTVTPSDPTEDVFSKATWAPGSFYDAAEPNLAHATTRRYTVLSCKEGDVFSFKMPTSNWRLYVYPADDKGSINGDWFELKDGMEYTIKAINGRTPTKLRVTACPNPDGQLTDAAWTTFDVKCFVSSGGTTTTMLADYNLFRTAEWKNGSYYGNAVHGGADRRHAFFPCNLNDTFTFDFTGKDFGLWVYYYDKDGEISDFGYTEITDDKTIKIEEKNGRIPTELRISVYPIAGGDISEAAWKTFDVSCTQESDYIKVATMNYGLWNDGATKYVEDSKVETVLAAWKKMLDDNDVDILCGQEWLKHFDRSNKLTAEDVLFAYKYKYQFSTASYFGKNLVSKFPVTDFTTIAHTKNPSRGYTKAYTEINGRKVCLINAHLSIETNFKTNRQAEYEDLLREMEKEEYVIVFGDFNAYTTSEFKNFTKAGYSVANAGKHGIHYTWTHFGTDSSWSNMAIDNIIVSPNIEILKVTCDRRELSDHNMLVAELRLLNEAPKAPDPSTDTSTATTTNTPADDTTDTTSDITTNTADVTGTSDMTSNATDANAEGGSLGLVIGLIVGAVVLVAAAVVGFIFYKKKAAAAK